MKGLKARPARVQRRDSLAVPCHTNAPTEQGDYTKSRAENTCRVSFRHVQSASLLETLAIQHMEQVPLSSRTWPLNCHVFHGAAPHNLAGLLRDRRAPHG